MEPVAGLVFIPAFAITSAASTVLAASVTDGIVVPGTLIAAFTLIGGYVWKFTRRADKVLIARIAELEVRSNYQEARADYWQAGYYTGSVTGPPPQIHDYYPTGVDDSDE